MSAKRIFQIAILGFALLTAGLTANVRADAPDIFPHAVWNKGAPAEEVPAKPVDEPVEEPVDKTIVFERQDPFNYDLDPEDEIELHDSYAYQTGDLPARFLLNLWQVPDFREAILDPGIEAYLKQLIDSGALSADDPALQGIEAQLRGGFFRPDPNEELVLFPVNTLQTGDIPERFLVELGPLISARAFVLDPGIDATLNRLIATGAIDVNNQDVAGALLSIESRLRGGLLGRSGGPGFSAGGVFGRGLGLLGR